MWRLAHVKDEAGSGHRVVGRDLIVHSLAAIITIVFATLTRTWLIGLAVLLLIGLSFTVILAASVGDLFVGRTTRHLTEEGPPLIDLRRQGATRVRDGP